MFDFRHTIVKGRLRALWEPGLFALPGVLFVWAGLVALHRLALHGIEGDATLVYVCIGILFVAGLCLALGRAGRVFAPQEGRWGFCLGLLRPLVCLWRPLAPYDRVVLESEPAVGEGRAYAVGLSGQKEFSLGVTVNAVVACSVAESLATFLGRPLHIKDGQAERSVSAGPFWGQTASFGGVTGGPKAKAEGGEVSVPIHATGLRGRGPLLLAVFMGVVLFLSWDYEQLTRSLWGIAAIGFVAVFCLWAVTFSVHSFLRRGSVRAEKQALTVEEKGLWARRRSFSWSDIVYLAVLPPKKGFLELAGRDGCVVVGDSQGSARVGESFRGEQLLALFRHLTSQLRKYTR
jgi:hypothetical protein